MHCFLKLHLVQFLDSSCREETEHTHEQGFGGIRDEPLREGLEKGVLSLGGQNALEDLLKQCLLPQEGRGAAGASGLAHIFTPSPQKTSTEGGESGFHYQDIQTCKEF